MFTRTHTTVFGQPQTGVDTGSQVFHLFLEGKHVSMNSQHDNGHHRQQQPGNGCSHQGPDQNYKPQSVDQPEMQSLPTPIPDPPIQYTKVSSIHSIINSQAL